MKELIYICLSLIIGILIAILIKFKELSDTIDDIGDFLVTIQKDVNFHGKYLNIGLVNLRHDLPDHYISENGEQGKLYRKKENK